MIILFIIISDAFFFVGDYCSLKLILNIQLYGFYLHHQSSVHNTRVMDVLLYWSKFSLYRIKISFIGGKYLLGLCKTLQQLMFSTGFRLIFKNEYRGFFLVHT